MFKFNYLLLQILLLILFSGCSSIIIPDQEFCGDAGPLGATCFTTLSNQTRDITPEEWEPERFGMICSKAETYATNVAIIQKACRLCKCCSYDAKKQILKFKEQVMYFQKNHQILY